MKGSVWDTLPRWLLTWLLCAALNLGLEAFLQTDGRWWVAALTLLVWCAMLAAAELFGRSRAMVALWVVAVGLCLLLADRELLLEAARSALSGDSIENGYGEFLLIVLCGAAALPVCALIRVYWIRAAVSLAWVVFWIVSAFLEWPVPRLVTAAMLPPVLLTLAETIRRLRREPEHTPPLRRALLLALLPTTLLMALLPAPAAPYGYPLLHSVVSAVEQLWEDVQTSLYYRREGDLEFGLSFNGVSDRAKVEDGSQEQSSGIIRVRPAYVPDGPVYLPGNTWDRFDGQLWTSSLRPDTARLLNERLDTAEHIYALWRVLDGEDGAPRYADYIRANYLDLEYQNLNIRTMFAVMDATYYDTDRDSYPFSDVPTGKLFDYLQQEQTVYRIYYLEPNARTLGELIARAEETTYDIEARGPRWFQVAQPFNSISVAGLRDDVNLEKTLAERAKMIQKVYLDCAGVSDRASALAREITAGCSRDSEKIAAITAYLQENYRYTLSPVPVPEGENFLDWLLFEGREGYCTWYATAAVLLSRSIGIPARYVQGYRGTLARGVFTELGSDCVHAWCECYIEGYGWVTAEATPGFAATGPGRPIAAETDAPHDREEELFPEEEKRNTHVNDHSGEAPILAVPDGADDGSGSMTEPAQPGSPSVPWPVIVICALLIAVPSAILLWRRARRRRRYSEADPSARLLMDLAVLLRDLRGKGYARQPEEPLRQYFARLPWRYLLADAEQAGQMAELYDRVFFGQIPPSPEELEQHRAFAARFRPRTVRQWLTWYRLQ